MAGLLSASGSRRLGLTLVVSLLIGCQGPDRSVAPFERFENSAAGSGQVTYDTEVSGRFGIDIELADLRPAGNYMLCLNALTSDGPESAVLGRAFDPEYGTGQFDSNGEGYWDFAAVTAGVDGACRSTHALPLSDELDEYKVKLLVKDIAANHSVMLQAQPLEFSMKTDRRIPFSWEAGGQAIGVVLVLLVFGWGIAHFRSRSSEKTGAPPSATMPAHKPLAIRRWEDLAIGITEDGTKYLAVTPCPEYGQVFPVKSSVELSFGGQQWKDLLELLAQSKEGNRASKKDVMLAFGYLKRGDVPAGQIDSSQMSVYDAAKRRLKNAMAERNRTLREENIDASAAEDGRPPLSVAEPGLVTCRFVVRQLQRDQDGRLRFGGP